MKKTILFLIGMLLPLYSFAAVPVWQISPKESSLTFTATQNNAPVSGSFRKFNGNIHFDKNDLNASKVSIDVDMTSVDSSYSDLTATLLTSDWFNAKMFPHAVFTAQKFIKIGDDQYQANGSLTIRDKTLPITLTFKLLELGKDKDRVIGSTMLKRTMFGVGQGEWASVNEVKDEVAVNFDITAMLVKS